MQTHDSNCAPSSCWFNSPWFDLICWANLWHMNLTKNYEIWIKLTIMKKTFSLHFNFSLITSLGVRNVAYVRWYYLHLISALSTFLLHLLYSLVKLNQPVNIPEIVKYAYFVTNVENFTPILNLFTWTLSMASLINISLNMDLNLCPPTSIDNKSSIEICNIYNTFWLTIVF